MLAALGWIRGEDSPIGAGSALVGGTMMSAGMLRLRAEEDAAAKAAEEARLAAEAKAKADAEAAAALAARKKAEEEKAAAAALAAAAAAAAAKKKAEEEAAAKAKADAEAAARKKAEEEKAAAAALAAAAVAAAAKKKAEEEAATKAAAAKAEEARLAAEAEAARVKLAKEEKAKAAALAATAAATAAANAKKEEAAKAAAAYANTGGSDNGGCMKWLPWLLGLLLIAGLLWWFLGRDACKKKAPVTPDPIENPVETKPEEPTPDPVPYGKNGDEMGYKAGSLEYLMANHLSGFDSNYPSGSFDADAVTFARNSARLNSAARKQMDNVIALLKEYPDAKIDIYGYLTDSESGSGNKEVSLDDDRARAVYNYLKRGGIDESRMNFQGEGIGDRRSAKIRVLSR